MLRVVAGVVMALMVIATPAAAESGMRYWSYWDGSTGSWLYATQGAGTTIVTDGAVQGWSFVVSSPTGEGARTPGEASPDIFTTVCESTPTSPTLVRVALVVDSGTPQIAPNGEEPFGITTTCVEVPEGSTGFDVLTAAHSVRADGGFLCGIDGYPATECAPVIDLSEFDLSEFDLSEFDPTESEPSESAESSTTSTESNASTTSPLTTIVAALVAVSALVLVWIFARRRTRS